jgi:hypothetical protein
VKKEMQKKPGDGEQFVLGLFQKLQILRTQCVIHKGRRGSRASCNQTQSLFSSQNTSRQEGSQALLHVTRIFEQERSKEGRKEGNE